MQNLGTLAQQYTILSVKREDNIRIYYNAINNQNQNNCIIEIKGDAKNNNDNFPAQETKILSLLKNANCPYILRYIENGIGVLALNNKPPRNIAYIVYENAPNSFLFDYIKQGRLSERQAKLLFKKILIGVQAIHNANICHRDIKIENIFLDDKYNPKIYGFYCSCINANNLQQCGSYLRYSPPEILRNRPYDGFEADIFNLGQLLFILVAGILGFQSSNENDHFYSFIWRKQINEYWNQEQFQNLNLTDDFKDLYIRMVAFNPNERPKLNDILSHQWMQEINNLNQDQLNHLEQELVDELHNRELQFNQNNN